jgi:hypothetical protein
MFAARLPDNRIVYGTQEGGLTKMVASDGEARYYSGTGQFNPNSWPSYTTMTRGNYLLNVCSNLNCTGCASNGITCAASITSMFNFTEPYDANLVAVRYVRFRRIQPSPNNMNEMAFTLVIAAQPIPTPSTTFVETGVLDTNQIPNQIPMQITGAVGLSTGIINTLSNVRIISANTPNATITIDWLRMYYLHGVFVLPLSGKWEQLLGVEMDYLDNNQQPVARKIVFSNANGIYPRVNVMYKFSPYFYTGLNQGGLPVNLSGRYVNIKQPTVGVFLNIRQIAIYNPQGLRYAPLPSSSQLYPTRYLSFHREYKQYLAAPRQTFNLQTNRGFTALALVRFKLPVTDLTTINENIFDFGSSAGLDNIMFYRGANNTIGASIRNNNSSNCFIVSNANAIGIDTWAVFGFRYIDSTSSMAPSLGTGTSARSAELRLYRNGSVIATKNNISTANNIASVCVNRTTNNVFIARSNWVNTTYEYAGIDIAGLMVYDRPLSDAEMTVCNNYLASYGTATGVNIPTGAIYNLQVSQTDSLNLGTSSGIQDFRPVNGWGPFRCLAQPATNSGLPVCSPEQQPLMNALEVVPMTATMSSVYGFGPQKLINDNFTELNFAQTNQVGSSTSSPMEWMSVDLGVNRPISKIVVYNRGPFNGSHWSSARPNDRTETRVIGSTVEVVNASNVVQWSRTIVSGGREYVYQS